jgi:hypothetical protein
MDLSAEYIFIYAPRNIEEIDIVMGIIRASAAYIANVPVESLIL